MDKTTLDRIRTIATNNSIDPNELLAAMETGNLPEELQDVMAAVVSDIALFKTESDGQDE
ncbi:MAG: hypothetical protein JEY79_02020 [Pseudodesulfovibrio sp.]|nr:hypothetical protein [Pseudodesulfovibrio sp.]